MPLRALSLAVAIMREGRFVQVGPPREVYASPVDRATAGVLGDLVVLRGAGEGDRVVTALGVLPVSGSGARGDVEVALRPEQVVVGAPVGGTSDGTVETVEYFGHDALVRVLLSHNGSGAGEVVLARVLGVDAPAPGQLVGVQVRGPVQAFGLAEPDRPGLAQRPAR